MMLSAVLRFRVKIQNTFYILINSTAILEINERGLVSSCLGNFTSGLKVKVVFLSFVLFFLPSSLSFSYFSYFLPFLFPSYFLPSFFLSFSPSSFLSFISSHFINESKVPLRTWFNCMSTWRKYYYILSDTTWYIFSLSFPFLFYSFFPLSFSSFPFFFPLVIPGYYK